MDGLYWGYAHQCLSQSLAIYSLILANALPIMVEVGMLGHLAKS